MACVPRQLNLGTPTYITTPLGLVNNITSYPTITDTQYGNLIYINGYIYAAISNSIYKFNASTYELISTTVIGTSSLTVSAYDPVNITLYIASQAPAIVTLNVITNATTTITNGVTGVPLAMVYNPADGNIYFTQTSGLYQLNTSTQAITTIANPAAGNLFSIAIDPTTGYLWVISQVVIYVYTTSGTAITTITPTGNPSMEQILYNPVTKDFYITGYSSNSMIVVNPATTSIIATVPVVYQPVNLTFDPLNNLIYILGLYSIGVFDPATNTYLGDIGLEGNLNILIFNPATGDIVVAPNSGIPFTLIAIRPQVQSSRLVKAIVDLPVPVSVPAFYTQTNTVNVHAPSFASITAIEILSPVITGEGLVQVTAMNNNNGTVTLNTSFNNPFILNNKFRYLQVNLLW